VCVCVCVCVRARARANVLCARARERVCVTARARVRCTCVRARCVCRVFFCWAFSLTARLVLASLNPRPRSLTPLHTICEHGSGAEERTLLPSNPGRAGEVVLTLITKTSPPQTTVCILGRKPMHNALGRKPMHNTHTGGCVHTHNTTPRYTQNISEHYSFQCSPYAVMLQHVEVQPISSVQLSGLVLSANVCNKS